MDRSDQARLEFRTARSKAFWSEIVSFLSGRPNRLLSWGEVRDKLGLRGQVYRGLQTVPVDKIIGSLGRYHDFDRAFMPTQDGTADRWCSIARAHYDAVNLPPVKLYQLETGSTTCMGSDELSAVSARRSNGYQGHPPQ